MSKRFTVLDFARCKDRGDPIVMLTGYDALFGALLDEAGIDAILVGDSVESVMAGAENDTRSDYRADDLSWEARM